MTTKKEKEKRVRNLEVFFLEHFEEWIGYDEGIIFTEKSPYHFWFQKGGTFIEVWPSTKKWRYREKDNNVVCLGKTDEYKDIIKLLDKVFKK